MRSLIRFVPALVAVVPATIWLWYVIGNIFSAAARVAPQLAVYYGLSYVLTVAMTGLMVANVLRIKLWNMTGVDYDVAWRETLAFTYIGGSSGVCLILMALYMGTI